MILSLQTHHTTSNQAPIFTHSNPIKVIQQIAITLNLNNSQCFKFQHCVCDDIKNLSVLISGLFTAFFTLTYLSFSSFLALSDCLTIWLTHVGLSACQFVHLSVCFMTGHFAKTQMQEAKVKSAEAKSARGHEVGDQQEQISTTQLQGGINPSIITAVPTPNNWILIAPSGKYDDSSVSAKLSCLGAPCNSLPKTLIYQWPLFQATIRDLYAEYLLAWTLSFILSVMEKVRQPVKEVVDSFSLSDRVAGAGIAHSLWEIMLIMLWKEETGLDSVRLKRANTISFYAEPAECHHKASSQAPSSAHSYLNTNDNY